MNRISSSFGEGVGVSSEGVSVVPAIALPGEIWGEGEGEGEWGRILMRSEEIIGFHEIGRSI